MYPVAATFLGTFLLAIFSLGTLIPFVHSKTDSQHVAALNVMYTSLNSPSKLDGWKASGGDPCGDSWDGITCSGSKVTEIRLSGLGLTGSLGYQLSNLKSVTYFDVSKNKLQQQIPYQLPPNAVYIDLSKNQFTGNVPFSISLMDDLEHLDLSNNKLSGQLTDMFQKLPKLKVMDLSNNKMSGNLPQSLSSLKSLTQLFLQNNKFTGKINMLGKLPLEQLNLANNKFTGWIPENLMDINNLVTDGNNWSKGKPPKGFKSAANSKGGGGGPKISTGVMIALIIVGVVLIGVLLTIVFFSKKRSSSSPSSFLDDEEKMSRKAVTPLASQELSRDPYSHFHRNHRESFESTASVDIKKLQKPPPPTDFAQSLNDNEFATRLNSKRGAAPAKAVCYTLSDLQSATSDFAPGRLLGEGSLGRVYRAKYPDGKVLAVKKIDSSNFHDAKASEEFAEIVASISKVHHPNIVELVGYCSEQGHNMLVYDYYRNGSLHDFLHNSGDFSNPLTWNTRVRIALATARAVEYLHEACSPSVIHKNIKSSNFLLDLDLNPHLCDYGLGNFHTRTSQNLGVGYNAPECTMPSKYTIKSDIYSFGVVMLELLTGRMPFDQSKPKPEQALVRWASPQLRDIDALEKMVDPALRGLYPPKSISRFADIVALCVQMEPEFRPPISEVVQALVILVQRSNMNMKDDLTASHRTEDLDY
ncbi:Protein STRUBBELIG-RECEPTOR FAMILY 5 [Linum perenne]